MSIENPAVPVQEQPPVDPVKAYKLAVEDSTDGKTKMSPLFGDKEAAQSFSYPWMPGRPAYGALPHLKSKEESLELFREEAEYFGKHYQPGEAGAPPWRDNSYAEGTILFEAKFGKKLSEFSEEILSQYPFVSDKKGKMISLFGLSGSGKSTAIEAIQESLGANTVVMDSDTVRYNLLGKMIKDAELANGATLEQVRNDLMHNNISGSMYFLLHHLTKELQDRGYTVVRSSTMPEPSADATFYVEHSDGIDPSTITDEQLPEIAKGLFERTQGRTHGADDYDWDHAETVTDFDHMKPVTVQVPERVHAIFVKNVRAELEKGAGRITRLKNPKIEDPHEREQNFVAQLKQVL